MRSNDVFRFSLQFNGETEENRRAGEFLESLKNRKSVVVVAALNEYLDRHPTENGNIKVDVSSTINEKTVRKLIEEIVSLKLSEVKVVQQDSGDTSSSLQEDIEADVAAMLDNLDLFT